MGISATDATTTGAELSGAGRTASGLETPQAPIANRAETIERARSQGRIMRRSWSHAHIT